MPELPRRLDRRVDALRDLRRLGEEWAYVVVPLRDEASGDAVSLPADALVPGQRVRLFLSDVEAMPTAFDRESCGSTTAARAETGDESEISLHVQ